MRRGSWGWLGRPPNAIYDRSTKELGFPGRLEKAKKLKGDKLERANMERSIETLAAGVKAVEKLRDAGEELVAKAKFSAK